MSDTEIRVVSLNCWGLKYVSKDRRERIAAIASVLAKSDYNIVALQEIWVEADYEHVRKSVSNRLPYAKLFHSGALGAGLAIFTSWPIIATSINPYSLNGEPTDALGGDWFVGKAAGSVTISHPVLGQVQIFNTHLYARGGEDGPEYNRTHRLVNAWEFAKLTRQAAELGRYVIAAGDFNSIPTSVPMTVIRDYSGLQDAWATTHPNIPPPARHITPLEGVEHYGVTADSPLNSYRDNKPSSNRLVRQYQGKRLDYILFRHPAHKAAYIPQLTCRETRVVFSDFIPGNIHSFSDHFGVETILDIHTLAGNGNPNIDLDIANYPAEDKTAPSELELTTIDTMLSALATSHRLSRYRSHKELRIFALCILLLFALIIGSAWIPVPWANPIFVFFTIFIAWLATTMLYEGFLYGNWELKALLNVMEELDLYRRNIKVHADPPLGSQ